MTIEEFGELTKEGKGEVTAYTKLEELQEKLQLSISVSLLYTSFVITFPY